jgi:murein DD-endopeptidase MepM/ murein hydrolase activator NlpD
MQRFPVHRLAPILALALVLASTTAHAQRGTYVVRAGDTLAEIARRHRVTVEALQQANRLRRENIRPGERLRIPGRAESGRYVPARRYTVRDGDTLARIARRHRVSVEDVQTANELRGENIRPGQRLWIPRPGVTGAQVRAAARVGNAAVAPDERPELPEDELEAIAARARELGLGRAPVGQRLLRDEADPRWIAAAGSAEELEGTLRMPVDGGTYLRGWGSGLQGYHLAIDIGAPQGTEIHAAERGLVAYVGDDIRGYGNLVVLVHANGWVTGYAQGPHLHFKFVHAGRHCDPMPLLRPLITAGRDGDPIETLELVWETERRPSGIRCLLRSQAPHPHRRWRHLGRGR